MQTYDEYSNERIPFGYLITFRSYGTWLHGTSGSVDRFHNIYGTPKLPADEKRKQYSQRLLKQPPVKLSAAQRAAILAAIKETCEIRKWELWASNIRSNHVHSVISANCKTKANTERTKSECNPEDEGSRLLEFREKSMGVSR